MQNSIIPQTHFEDFILLIRGQKVLLDSDLARLYEVPTKRLNEQVQRNLKRFPEDFMFRLSEQEYQLLRSQNATLETQGKGKYRKYLPYAFTEQGVAMLSSVLKSDKAIEVNIEIMRVFVKLRNLLAQNQQILKKLLELEKRYDSQFQIVFNTIRELMTQEVKSKRKIGFLSEENSDF